MNPLRAITKSYKRGGDLQKRVTNTTGTGIDFNKDNNTDASGADSNYLLVRVVGTGDDGSGNAIRIENDSDGGLFLLKNNTDGGIQILDDGTGGILLHATGSGFGFSSGQLTLLCDGGRINLKNDDGGVVVRSTGIMGTGSGYGTAGSVVTRAGTTTWSSFSGSSDFGMLFATADGIVFAQDGPDPTDENFDLANLWMYLEADGNIRMPLLPTSDPGKKYALYIDGSGFVKQSL